MSLSRTVLPLIALLAFTSVSAAGCGGDERATATPIAIAAVATEASPTALPMAPVASPEAVATERPTRLPRATATPSSPTVIIGSVSFGAEVVHTPADRVRGLSGRERLPPGTGMLFVFETGVASAFWMREMLLPLDFVWIGKDCTVVDIVPNAPNPEPDTPDSELPLYTSAVTAAYTFEINRGEAESSGLRVGDKVSFSGFSVEGADC